MASVKKKAVAKGSAKAKPVKSQGERPEQNPREEGKRSIFKGARKAESFIRQIERLRVKFPLDQYAGEWLAYARIVKTIGDVEEAAALKAVQGDRTPDAEQEDRIATIKRKKSQAVARAKSGKASTMADREADDADDDEGDQS